MKRFPVSLTALSLVFVFALALPARAQTPPNEPSDFTTRFVAYGSQTTILELVSGNPKIQWLPGFVMGNLFDDFTNNRVRIDILDLHGTAVQSDYLFYDKKRQYTWNYARGSCQQTALTSLLHPFFNLGAGPEKLANDPNSPQLGLSTWRYLPPSGVAWDPPRIDLTVAEDAPQTPIAIAWYAPFVPSPAVVTFVTFNSGAPDASLFNLPAGCAP